MYACMLVCMYYYYSFPRDQPMTTRRAPELYSFGEYYAAASARVLCSTHTQQGPRIRSRETAAPWVIKSLAPNIFFRVCVCMCAAPSTQRNHRQKE